MKGCGDFSEHHPGTFANRTTDAPWTRHRNETTSIFPRNSLSVQSRAFVTALVDELLITLYWTLKRFAHKSKSTSIGVGIHAPSSSTLRTKTRLAPSIRSPSVFLSLFTSRLMHGYATIFGHIKDLNTKELRAHGPRFRHRYNV